MMTELSVPCPRCGSENIWDVMAFTNYVELAICKDCDYEFSHVRAKKPLALP